MKKLYLLCGPAGSGKSTWAKKMATFDKGIIVSRDEVHFQLVPENKPYFSKEKEVFEQFILNIKAAIEKNDIIYVDATHITEESRNKVLDRLDLTEINVIPVNFIIPLELNFQFNDCRSGREFVPRSVIHRMRAQFEPATDNEKYQYSNIINIY